MSGNAEALVPLLSGWKACDLLVVGDFMLDQAQHGSADRLSPDAPVPVFDRDDVTALAGFIVTHMRLT